MNIKELKEKIENRSLDDKLIIFECPDNYFLAEQYINKIATCYNKTIINIDKLERSPNKVALYVYTCDQFDEDIPIGLSNIIIKCKKIKNTKLNDYIITTPKLLDWQIEDYVFCNLNTTKELAKKLCISLNYNIYQLDYTIKFLATASKQNIEKYIKSLFNTSKIELFDLTNLLLKRSSTLETDINSKDIIFQLNSILTKNFKNVYGIQKGINFNDLGITNKQYFAIKMNNTGYYSNDECLSAIETITKLDKKIKNGIINIDIAYKYLLLNIL